MRRREAPPDGTGSEAALLSKIAATGALVEIRLETGEIVTGHVEWADRASVKIRRPDAPAVLVMKHAIVSLGCKPGSGRRG